MSLLSMAKAAMPWPTGEPVLGDGFVVIPVEARDALVELADAARSFVATTSYYRQRKESRPEFEEFTLALERLQR